MFAKTFFDVDGTPVRAHTTARELEEAVDLLEERLRDRLEHLTERRQALRKRGPAAREPHEWRHGDLPARRPPYYDFHLFTGADTGAGCLVSRRPDGRVGIASTGPLPPQADWLVYRRYDGHYGMITSGADTAAARSGRAGG